MFEKYTEEARRVIFFARYEASQFGASEIKSEHLLMGLIREDKELINKFFNGSKNLLDLDFVYKEVEVRTHKLRGIEPYTYDLELSLEVKRILACASEEYEKLQSKYLSTEHLLLGILGTEEQGIAGEILRGQGLSFDSVKDRIKSNINN
ncbi:MAG: ATP-dependent Clp protease ATP-binding subunit ClpC, partial [Blastocatellia bacterium]|nr:ATP-dependent Clp protease ATP-binding subunit ClpC [Blastocatellia bacterium]